MKVKHFEFGAHLFNEERINEFMASVDVVDVKMTVTRRHSEDKICVVVLYRDRSPFLTELLEKIQDHPVLEKRLADAMGHVIGGHDLLRETDRLWGLAQEIASRDEQ